MQEVIKQANKGWLTEKVHGIIFRGPLAKFLSPQHQVLPPVLALILEFVAFACIPLLLMGYLLLSNSTPSSASASLNGLWKTKASGYTDRFLEIRDNVIMFGTGGDTLESYVIKAVETEPDDSKTLYTISYLDKNMNTFHLAFYYEARRKPLITFKYQDHLTWTRVQE